MECVGREHVTWLQCYFNSANHTNATSIDGRRSLPVYSDLQQRKEHTRLQQTIEMVRGVRLDRKGRRRVFESLQAHLLFLTAERRRTTLACRGARQRHSSACTLVMATLERGLQTKGTGFRGQLRAA